MNLQHGDLLTPVLRAGASATSGFSAGQWELLIRQARHSNLLSRLAVLLELAGLLQGVPDAPRQHMLSALKLTQTQERAVRWEVGEIGRTLAALGGPVVLLKGVAYVLAGLPAAQGRLFSDTDILVPRAHLHGAETLLLMAGWERSVTDAYDDHYYRQWMHEVPPLVHGTRSTVLDLHHNILPLTSRLTVDAELLLAGIVPVDGGQGLYRLGNADLILHSACHLFLDGEFDKGLRDLLDLDSLLCHFGAQNEFWAQLQARAQMLGLARVLFYALRYAQQVLGTPVPATALVAAADAAPPAWQLWLMDNAFRRALRPDHPSCAVRWTALARQFLYLRGHWMRMPLNLLLRHLATKAFRPRETRPA